MHVKVYFWCRREELNFRPHPYQGCALPLSYGGLVKKHYNYMGFYQLANLKIFHSTIFYKFII